MPLPLGEVFVPKPNIKGAEGGCGRGTERPEKPPVAGFQRRAGDSPSGKPSRVLGNYSCLSLWERWPVRVEEGCSRLRPVSPHPLTPSRGKGEEVS